jgi:hypothetical protein
MFRAMPGREGQRGQTRSAEKTFRVFFVQVDGEGGEHFMFEVAATR